MYYDTQSLCGGNARTRCQDFWTREKKKEKKKRTRQQVELLLLLQIINFRDGKYSSTTQLAALDSPKYILGLC